MSRESLFVGPWPGGAFEGQHGSRVGVASLVKQRLTSLEFLRLQETPHGLARRTPDLRPFKICLRSRSSRKRSRRPIGEMPRQPCCAFGRTWSSWSAAGLNFRQTPTWLRSFWHGRPVPGAPRQIDRHFRAAQQALRFSQLAKRHLGRLEALDGFNN